MNTLLQNSDLPFEAIKFNEISITDFQPAIEEAIQSARVQLEQYKQGYSHTFDDVLIGLDEIGHKVEEISTIFFNLHSAECPEELAKIAPVISEKLTHFSSDISLDPQIFKRIKACYDHKGGRVLNPEEQTYLEETYRSFVRNGALLSDDKKARIRQIDEELSKLSLTFSQNLLKASNNYLLLIEDKKRLEGCPESFLEASSELAEKKGHPGKWAITLDYPILIPVLSYAKDRSLRHEVWKANNTKATSGEWANQELIKNIVRLRQERAELLGYSTHAHFVLAERMAQSPEKVMSFLEELLQKSLPFAKKDLEKLKKLALELDQVKDFQRWDQAYYSEILKLQELNYNGEELRPYFSLEKVIEGIFLVANKLYQLEFKEKTDYPTYHPDVKTFEVIDPNKGFIGLFYADFFPRETKRNGAWMTSYRTQGKFKGVMKRPHVSIVCNFTKPTKTKPSLLTLEEVLTLYHEFGHALHGLLSQCQYPKLSGTNVYWDFVELPSQMMENWVSEKECLDLFAKHFETGETMPASLVEKIKKSGKFLEGLATVRQVSLSLLDMHFHLTDPAEITDVEAFEKKINQKTDLLPPIQGVNMSCGFSHIFAGGYSSGYYSYKWAEVLDADAFAYFEEKGIFDQGVAQAFRQNILEKGGSEHPMELYKRFRGKEPSIEPLLKRAGLA